MKPISEAKEGGLHSAPTIAMKPVPAAKEEGIHSAPTVPMKSVPAFLAEQARSAPSAPPVGQVAVEQAPRSPPPPAKGAMAPPPAAPRPSPPPPEAVQPQASRPEAAPPVESRPVRRVAKASVRLIRRPQQFETQPGPPPRSDPASNPTLSTDVQLKISSLHKMAEQAQTERKNALMRRVAPRSTRSLPVVRPGAPGVGLTTPPELIVQAPLQSYPSQRTASHTQNVINQYVVTGNARYFPQPGGPREAGHLFVFDVMNSLHTSLGRAFPGNPPGTFRPGTLAEMWKWLKETAFSRGWRVVEGSALVDATARGLPVIAMAETPTGPRLAVVEPVPLGNDGKPRLASAYEPRGQRQKPDQVFGTSTVRYLAHD